MFIYNKMKKEEEQDKAKAIANNIKKLEKQKELRNILDIQLKEKEKSKSIEKVGNDFFHNQVISDKNNYDSSEKNKKLKHKVIARQNFELITEQINEKKSKNPDEVINKFGTCAMNKEEFLMNKSILLDISKKKMELLG